MSELRRQGVPGASQCKQTPRKQSGALGGQLGCVCQKDLAGPGSTLLRGEVKEGDTGRLKQRGRGKRTGRGSLREKELERTTDRVRVRVRDTERDRESGGWEGEKSGGQEGRRAGRGIS